MNIIKKNCLQDNLSPPNYYLLKKFICENYFNRCWSNTDPYRFEFMYLSDEDIPSLGSIAYDFLHDLD